MRSGIISLPIDYKSLGVPQVGSIYEGLLEFKLRIAPTEMAVVKGKKTEEVIPYTEALQKKAPIIREGRGKDARDKTLPRSATYLIVCIGEKQANYKNSHACIVATVRTSRLGIHDNAERIFA